MQNTLSTAIAVNNLTQRIITGSLFGIVMICGILVSVHSCLILFTLIVFMIVYEYLRLLTWAKSKSIVTAAVAALLVLLMSCIQYTPPKLLVLGVVIITTFLALRELRLDRKKSLLINAPVVFGVIYLLLPFYLLIQSSPVGYGFQILYFFIIVWAGDTFAYFAGRAFGSNKLWPSISPKKTVEGFIGGIIGAIVFGFIFNHYLELFDWTVLIISSLAITVFAMYGDLIESKFKRNLEIKDSGKILPGHGGILDRFDGVLLSAPIYFLIIRYLHI